MLHTDAFTHRSFYAKKSLLITARLLHSQAFTHTHTHTRFAHGNFDADKQLQYPEQLLHAGALTHRGAFRHKRFYTQKLLHTEASTHGRFCTQKILQCFYTKKHLRAEALTLRNLYTEKLCTDSSLYAEIQKNILTQRNQRSHSAEELSQRAFTHKSYRTENLLHTDAFMHINCNTTKFLLTDAFHANAFTQSFTRKCFYAQMPLHNLTLQEPEATRPLIWHPSKPPCLLGQITYATSMFSCPFIAAAPHLGRAGKRKQN